MRILISGVGGFVGRRFARRLVDLGYDVTGVDDLSAGIHPVHWAFKPEIDETKSSTTYKPLVAKHGSFSFFKEDIRHYFKMQPAGYFDLVIHCAAVVGGRLKIEGDPLAVATDLAIDADLFNWAVRTGRAADNRMPKVIYFSSSAAYPVELQTRENYCKLREEMLTFDTNRVGMPDMTYGWAKLTGELLAHHARKVYGLDVVIYRPFGGYGEDQSLDYPFPSIVRRVLAGEDPVTVWGSGEQCRDFIYIEDIIDAVLATYDKVTSGTTLNLGTGVATSFAFLAWETLRQCGSLRRTVEADRDKPEGVFYRVADTVNLDPWYKATTLLEEGIRKVADHMKKGLTPPAA